MTEDSSCMFSPSHIATGVVVLLVGAVVGAAVYMFADPLLPASLSNSQKGYQTGHQAGFDEAKKLVENSPLGGMLQSAADVDPKLFNGTVTAINGNTLTVHTQSTNPFADQSLNDRIVTVDASTKISSNVLRDQKVFQAEMANFIKTRGTASELQVALPTPYTQLPGSISSIKVGDVLNVTASQDVTKVKEFTVAQIEIQPSTAPTTAK